MPKPKRNYPSLLPKPPTRPSASRTGSARAPEPDFSAQVTTRTALEVAAQPTTATMSGANNDNRAQASTVSPQAVNSSDEIRALQEQLRSMQSLISAQQRQIEDLLSYSNPGTHATTAPGPSVKGTNMKGPQISAYSGKCDELTSTRVKAFIYIVMKVGTLSGMTEPDMLALADCYFRDKAATWMMGLEAADCKPSTMSKLQEAMIAEFVPADEKARGKAKLMRLRMNAGVEKYISEFRELIAITETPTSEAFYSFFLGLPDEYKEELTKKFPTGAPTTLQEVYDAARTHELATQWTKNRPGRKHHPPSKRGPSPESRNTHTRPNHKRKDPKAATWGPAGGGEKGFYRRNTRCFLCGYKWTPDHDCKGDSAEAPAPRGPANDNDPKA